MAEVKHFIDQSSIQQDADFLKGALDEILAKLEAIKKVRVDLSGLKTFGDASKLAKDLQKAQEDLLKVTNQLSVANTKLNNQKISESRLRQQERKELADIQKEKDRVLKQQEKEVNNIDKLNNEYIQLNNRYKEASAASLRRGAELLKEAKGNNDLFLSLLKTDKAYDENTRRAKEYSAQLLLLEQNIGRSQRNVGNYAGTFNGLNRQFALIANELPSLTISVKQFALALSNNLPIAAEEIRLAQREIAALKAEGKTAPSLFQLLSRSIFSFQVGLSIAITFLVAFSDEIVAFVSNIFKSKTAIDEAKLSVDNLNKAFDESSVKDAVKNINELTINVGLARQGFLKKEDVVKQYNETIGKTTGLVKDLDEVEKILVENGQAYIQMMLFKAAANLALEEASKKALAAEIQRQRKNEEFAKGGEESIASFSGATGGGLDDVDKKRREADRQATLNRAKRKKEAIDEEQDQADAFLNIAENFQKQAAEIAKQFNFNFFDPEKEKRGRKERIKSIKDFSEEERKAANDRAIALIKQEQNAQREIFENENNSYESRLQAAENFFQLDNLINKKNNEFELNELLIQQKEYEDELVKSGLSRAQAQEKAEKDFYNRRQLIITTGLINEFDAIKNNQDNIIKITQEYYKTINEEQEKANNFFKGRSNRDFSKEKAELEKQRDEELLLISEQANAGVLTYEEGERKKLEVKQKYAKLLLQSELKLVEDLLSLETDPVKKAELEAKAAAIRLKIDTELTEGLVRNKKTVAEAEKELAQLQRQLYEEIFQLAQTFTLGRFDAEKNKIADQIQLVEERKRKEIDFIDATVTNEIEKQARITNAEKRAQNERERLEFRQRQLDIQRARFEKAFNVAKIISDTAVAIVKAFRDYTFAAALPISVTLGAIGAAQAAAVLAQPVPRFKTGKGDYDKYEGPAWVGDGGKSEMIFREDGTVEKTPATPVLTYVGKNDIIHPDADALVNSALQKQGSVFQYHVNGDYEFDRMTSTLKNELRNVAKTIKNKREYFVTMQPDGFKVITKDGNRIKEHLNKNLQFGK